MQNICLQVQVLIWNAISRGESEKLIYEDGICTDEEEGGGGGSG